MTGLLSVYLDISTQFRDGVEWFFVKLHEKKVPVLIISGGLGGITFCIRYILYIVPVLVLALLLHMPFFTLSFKNYGTCLVMMAQKGRLFLNLFSRVFIVTVRVNILSLEL